MNWADQHTPTGPEVQAQLLMAAVGGLAEVVEIHQPCQCEHGRKNWHCDRCPGELWPCTYAVNVMRRRVGNR